VLGHALLRDVEVLGDLVDGARLVAHEPEDRAAARVGEGVEGGVRYERAAAAVYDAVASPRDWWTARAGVAAREGDHLRLDWSHGDFTVFRLDSSTGRARCGGRASSSATRTCRSPAGTSSSAGACGS
jgi:hypothetical protein